MFHTEAAFGDQPGRNRGERRVPYASASAEAVSTVITIRAAEMPLPQDALTFTTSVRPSCARHTHASNLIDAGIDVVKISQRLGHADPTVDPAHLCAPVQEGRRRGRTRHLMAGCLSPILFPRATRR